MRALSVFAFALFTFPAWAQEKKPSVSYQITLTEQQIDGIIEVGAACLEKTPYACAEYTIYIRNLLQAAKQPKPEPKKE